MTRPFAALLIGLLTLLVGCDALEQIAGVDPVKDVVRDNPVDPVSTRPLVFSLDSDETVVGTVRPSIRFSLAEGVSSYSLQIAATPDFSAPLAYEETGITEPIHRIATPLANHGHYHWRVRPRYADGKDGGWSGTKELEVELPVPVGLVPSNGSVVGSPFPALSWEATTTAGFYEVQYAEDPEFATNSSTLSEVGASGQLPTALADGSSCFWRVRATEEGVTGDWSVPATFQVALPVLQVLFPANGQSLHDLQFHWNPGSYDTAIADAIGFQIEVNTDSSFAPATSFFAFQSLSRTDPVELPLSLGGSYHWRVRVQYSQGFWGPCSSSGLFVRDRVSQVVALPLSYSSPSIFVSTDGGLWIAGSGVVGSISVGGTVNSHPSEVKVSDGVVAGADGSIYQIANYGTLPGIKATASDGTALWTFSTPYNSLSGMALAPDGTLYTSYWLRDTAPSMFRFLALTPSGSEKWSYDAPYGTTNRDSVVVTTDGTVCFATSEQVYAFTSSGSLRWTYPVRNAVLSAGKNGVLFIVDPWVSSDSESGLSVVDSQGALLWKHAGGVRTSPIVDGSGNLYLSLGDRSAGASTELVCLSSSGVPKWSTAIQGLKKVILGSDAVLYTLDHAYPANPTIHAISAADGLPLWANVCQADAVGDMNIGPNGNLYLMFSGNIDVIQTSSQGVDPDSPWPMTGGDSRGTRCAAP